MAETTVERPRLGRAPYPGELRPVTCLVRTDQRDALRRIAREDDISLSAAARLVIGRGLRAMRGEL